MRNSKRFTLCALPWLGIMPDYVNSVIEVTASQFYTAFPSSGNIHLPTPPQASPLPASQSASSPNSKPLSAPPAPPSESPSC
jgi:hypothetical protein